MSSEMRNPAPNVRRAASLGLNPTAVHLAVLLAVGVAIAVLRRRGDVEGLRHMGTGLTAVAVLALGTVVVLFARARRPAPRFFRAGLAAVFASYLCSLLARLPALAAAARPLGIASQLLILVALPFLVVVAWRVVRGTDRAG